MSTEKEKHWKAFGAQVIACRERRGWLQADLAKRLEVGQQTVSRWEKGASRPKPSVLGQLAKILTDHSFEEWKSLSGYTDKKLTAVAPPLLPELPMSTLGEDRFEDFCCDVLAAKHPLAGVNRVGSKGDTQGGIDIEVKFPDDKLHGFQCKRHKTFGKEKVKVAMKELTIDVDKAVILLSRPATADARSAVRRSRKWEILDSIQISRIIRNDLTREEACRIVDTYFPGLRAGFLGIDDPSPFLSVDRFFAPFLKQTIFSHAWTLVGRKEVVSKICDRLQKEAQSVLVLHGSGGIGKSRTVKAVCEEFQKTNPDVAVRIVDPATNVTPKHFELLRGKATLLVVDDAHDRTDAEILYGLAARSDYPVRMLIVTRPFALETTKRNLSRILPISEENTFGLQKLKKDEVKELSREILANLDGPVGIADRIADVTSDSPLATVVASYLVATKRVNPSIINNEAEFRVQLFNSFEEAITGELGASDPDLTKDTLGLISLVQPVDLDDPEFRSLAQRVIDKPIDKILRTVTRLHESGVLLKRGRRLRITPDLLAEYVIENRCVIPITGSSSGYAETVAQSINANLLHHVIVNVARLDWRVSQSSEGASKILDPLWKSLLEQYETNAEIRSTLLEAISEAAFFQPQRALDFFDKTKANGDTSLRELPTLLKRVAYTYNYLDDACERLWELGKDDSRALNQYPSHPIRILGELALVEPDKPLEYSHGVLDFALRKLKGPDIERHAYSLFEVLDSVLKTDGHQTHSHGYSITLKGFQVRFEAVKELRRKAISALFHFIRQRNTTVAVRAARCLHAALRYPMNGGITDRDQWTPEFLNTLSLVKEVYASGTLDPVVILELQKSINWHAVYAAEPTKGAAREAKEAIRTDLTYKVTMNILDGWGELRERGGEDYEVTQQKIQDDATATAAELLQGRTPQEVVAFLEERFRSIRRLRADSQSHTGLLLSKLVEANPEIGNLIWATAIRENESYPLIESLDGILGALLSINPATCLSISRQALATGRDDLARSVSFAYGWRGRTSRPFTDEEMELISTLLVHKDVSTAFGAIRTLENVAISNVARAMSLFLTIDFSQGARLVHEVFMVLMHNTHFLKAIKEKKLFEALLNKLLPVAEIDDYWVTAFISTGSETYAQETLDFLIARIEREQSLRDDHGTGYDSIPWLWAQDAKLKFRKSSAFTSIVTQLVGWMTNKKDWVTQKRGAVLFAAVSGGYDETTISALSASLLSSDPGIVEAASQMLSEAPRTLVFSQQQFVIKILAHAHALGSETYKAVSSDLWSSAISGVRHGSPGQPFPEDVAMKESSEAIMKTLPKGSPAWEFYAGMKSQSESFINVKWNDDLEDFDDD